MIKDREYLIPTQFPKFNDIQIKLDSNGIVLIKETFLIIDHAVNSTSFGEIIRKKLLSKE